MTERWVVNASPLIVLCSIHHEHLLLQLADEILVPSAAVREIDLGPKEDRAKQLLTTSYLQITETPPPPAELHAWDLGAGETAVLAYAIANPDWTVILDDGAARRCAQTFSIAMKGTLGIVILARKRGLIPSASDVLHRLRAIGFRINDRVVADALQRTVGEDWR